MSYSLDWHEMSEWLGHSILAKTQTAQGIVSNIANGQLAWPRDGQAVLAALVDLDQLEDTWNNFCATVQTLQEQELDPAYEDAEEWPKISDPEQVAYRARLRQQMRALKALKDQIKLWVVLEEAAAAAEERRRQEEEAQQQLDPQAGHRQHWY
ncbi:hypothetical protein QBC41DRAFT_305678 [Cercophora samala]|uniref:Uncharacterized protein n=1 Tax=Cercophora samala TaxID=330535 RepID=A0AA39Z899_9PEZI|nr:hypothetical protein QBC41DRAFT_305678 [Cercophora samala]